MTTTDALKAFALALILVDHIGHFLLPDWPILRVIGRLGVPVFFFLIGFARTRDIPWRWLALGVALTGVDFLWLRGLDGLQLNILFNFALIRLALPLIERHALAPPWRLAGLMLALAAMIPLANPILEYGAEGWLLALLGLVCRKNHDGAEGQNATRCLVVAIGALSIYWLVETMDYAFPPIHSGMLMIGLLVLGGQLLRFERRFLGWRSASMTGRLLHFAGRYSLEIYAAQIILLAALGGFWGSGQGSGG